MSPAVVPAHKQTADFLTEHPTAATSVQASRLKTSSFHLPELDALRFLAFAMIFVHHILPHNPQVYSHGAAPHFEALLMAHTASALGAGLPLFFTLSAYLLTSLLLKEKRRSGTVHMKAFYVRRMLRIWPLYFLAIGLAWLGAHFIAHDPRCGLFLAYLFMMGNWTRQLSLAVTTPVPLAHLWSISVEEQFYVLFPALVRFGSRGLLLGFAGFISCLSLATLLFLGLHQTPADQVWRNSLVQFLMFAVGIIVGVYTDRRGLPTLRDSHRVLLVGLAMAIFVGAECSSNVMTGAGGPPTPARLIAWYLPVAIGCAMLLIGTLGFTRKVPSSLVYLGRISYGLYVFHAWGLSGATALLNHIGIHRSLALKDLLALALTVIAAMLSYRYFEAPFLKLKSRFTFLQTRAGLATLASPR